MEGLSRLAGIGPTLCLGGERFVVRALRLRDFALIEAELLSRLVHPCDAVRHAWQVHDNKPLLRIACESAAQVAFTNLNMTFEQYAAWRQSPSGRLFVLWLALDRPKWSWFTEAVDQECRKDFMWMHRADIALGQANGNDERGILDALAHSSGGKADGWPWEVLYRRLHENGLSAEQIGELTLPQLNVFVCKESSLRGSQHEYGSLAEIGRAASKRKQPAELADRLYRECQ